MSQQKPRGRSVQTATATGGMRTFYVIFGVVAVVVVAVLLYMSLGTSTTSTTGTGVNGTVPAKRGADIPTGQAEDGRFYLGQANAPVTVIMYADYQCPGCGHYTSNFEANFEKEFVATGKVRMVFHDFPLSMHPNAVNAAVAARCAGSVSSDAYWQMHDMLYTNQRQWSSIANNAINAQFTTYAAQIGIDTTAFTSCIADQAVTDKVLEFQRASNALGLPGTPSFAVNGKVVDAANAQSIDDIDKLVRAAVAAALP
jgi:protein-disulfide isomerase